MEFLRNLGRQLARVWQRATAATRLAYAVAIGASILGILGIGYWSSRPQWIPLANGLPPAEVANLVAKLEAGGVSNRLNISGTGILVDRRDWNQARVVLGDDAPGLSDKPAEMQESFFSDPEFSRYSVLRHREESLARTIERFPAVANATVHLGQPESTPFVSERTPTTASVVLELRSGAPFSQEQAASIVTMLANSIEGLSPENVTVIDSKGRVLASQGSLGGSEAYAQFEYRRRLESDLAAKANVMLDQMLGHGRAVVRVTADVDFTQTHREEKTYDPDLKVRTREMIKSKQRKGGGGSRGTSAPPGGSPGTGTGAGGSSDNFTETEEENETSYETAYSVDSTTQMPGRIQRLTIAAMVSLPKPGSAEDAPSDDAGDKATPVPTVNEEQVAALIKQAVGFDAERGDQIEVVVTELVGHVEQEQHFAAAQRWELYQSLARNSSLGIASLVALVLGLTALRKIQPMAAAQDAPDDERVRRLRAVSDLAQRAQENPDVIKAVVTSWLHDDESRRRAA